MKRANKQLQERASTRRGDKRQNSQARRRLLMENLEQRQLLAADATDLPILTGFFSSNQARTEYVAGLGDRETLRDNRTNYYASGISPLGGGGGSSATGSNGGSADPRVVVEKSTDNDAVSRAQLVNLGTEAGKNRAVQIGGVYDPPTDANGFIRRADEDFYAVDLRGGDIISAQINGGGNIMLLDGNDVYANDGDLFMLSELDQGQLAFGSELLFGGDANLSYVIPRDGRYYISTSGSIGSYQIDLRVFRPVLEQQEVGTSQILFLDFDGALLNSYPFFPIQPRAFLEPLSQYLPQFNLQMSDLDQLIDRIIASTKSKFESAGLKVANGFFPETGEPGDYNLVLLNSRDHADPWGQPNVSRVIIGGDVDDAGGMATLLGIAESIDVGNFNTEESSVVFAGNFPAFIPDIPRTAAISELELAARMFGHVIAHEAGHTFGLWHQLGTAISPEIMSSFIFPPTGAGGGPDGIVGNADDVETYFGSGFFDSLRAFPQAGFYNSADWLAWSLSTGTQGGTVSGTVFNDINRSKTQNGGEGGIAGVTVFADINGNGSLDVTEQWDTTDASGNYSFKVAPGSVEIRAIAPNGFAPTTAASKTVSVSLNGTVDADFGFVRVVPDLTGIKWNDLNGDGVRDAGEPGIGGVYIYVDLDGDQRIDLGEPRAVTKADGSYSINFPGAGTYTLREVVEPGFTQTFPAQGFHEVDFNGTTLADNYDFGNQSVVDYGDAPAPYPTLADNNGAAHGILAGFGLGELTDAEADGQPTAAASGDDTNGTDDEDGILLRSPLSPGSTTNLLEVSVRNADGATSYLQGWIDLNRDGDWNDAGERIISDQPFVGSGTEIITFALPASAQLGETFARFRLSSSPGTAPTGFVSGGEVEDYRFNITATPELASDDTFNIPRGSGTVELDLLANDFDPDFNPLTIDSVDTTGTRGSVVIATDGRSVFYTPQGTTLGQDSFTYTVVSETGNLTGTATVDLNLIFQSVEPLAVDDSFHLQPSNTGIYTLDVLPNDIPSVVSDSQIIAHSSPASGSLVTIVDGGQRIRYAPAPGFSGTEQFTYTISDTDNQQSTATVTVHLLPAADSDDRAAFTIQTLANDGVTPISAIEAGQLFKVRVLVDDIRAGVGIVEQGLGSAYLDLLYSESLVSPVFRADESLDISYGPLFQSLATGDADIPGIINEVGATQQIDLSPPPPFNFSEPEELFTLTLRAVSPGLAEFVTDPADLDESPISETVLLNDTDSALTPSEIRFGRRQLTIVPGGTEFTFAVDDSYPDGRDSQGNVITSSASAILNVLANDRPTGGTEIVSIGSVANGTATINTNGTPDDPTDDRIAYRPRAGFVGVEQFTYTIRSADGLRSTAEVTVAVGNAGADDLVGIELNLLDAAGNPVTEVTVGDTFQLRIMVDDLRDPAFGEARGVFAAYMDVLYDSGLARLTDTTGDPLGFDVTFGDDFDPNPAVGDALIPGLINEFGTFQSTSQGSGDPLDVDPVEFATITFVATAAGNLRFAADPADVSPFQDTLLFEPPNVVPIDRIRYDVVNLTIRGGNGSAEGESTLQNQNNRMDVNDDGQVSPIDALLVLNRLNRNVGEGESIGVADKYFWDVNGDKVISPVDALQVINYLNRGGSAAGGEGEAAPPVSGGAIDAVASNTRGDLEATDTFFSSLGGSSTSSSSVTSTGATASGSTSSLLGASIETSDDDDEKDQDDLLHLLAEDSGFLS